MATYSNLYIDQGSNFSATIDLSQTTGSLDLSGHTAAGTIAKSYDGTSKGSFTVSVDDTNNELDVSLTAAETAALKPGRYVYDVIIKSSAGVITRVLEGQLEVTPGVTFDAAAPETTLGAGNVSSSESSSSSSSTAIKSVFTKTFVTNTGSGAFEVNPHSDAYAFIELDQNISYNANPAASITVSLDFAHTKGASYSSVFLFLATDTLVDNWINWESAGAFKYLAIVIEDTSSLVAGRIEREAQFEISDLEIKESSNPGGEDVKFITPKRVYNASETTSSGHGDSDTEFKFDSISSTTGLFKS